MLVPLLTALHLIIVVLWIGGVAFVTMIIFPMLSRMEDSFEQVLMFQRIEHRFGGHAKIYTALSGITGGILLYLTGEEKLLFSMQGIGVTMMTIAWALYFLVLIFEKKLFGVLFSDAKKFDPKKVFSFLTAFHWVILGVSLLAVFLGVWSAHGGAL